MVFIYLSVLAVLVVSDAIDAFEFGLRCIAFSELMLSRAEGASFFITALRGSMVVFTAFVAPVYLYVVFYFAYLPADFQFLLYK